MLGRVDDDCGIHELGEVVLAAWPKLACSRSAGSSSSRRNMASDAVPAADLSAADLPGWGWRAVGDVAADACLLLAVCGGSRQLSASNHQRRTVVHVFRADADLHVVLPRWLRLHNQPRQRNPSDIPGPGDRDLEHVAIDPHDDVVAYQPRWAAIRSALSTRSRTAGSVHPQTARRWPARSPPTCQSACHRFAGNGPGPPVTGRRGTWPVVGLAVVRR